MRILTKLNWDVIDCILLGIPLVDYRKAKLFPLFFNIYKMLDIEDAQPEDFDLFENDKRHVMNVLISVILYHQDLKPMSSFVAFREHLLQRAPKDYRSLQALTCIDRGILHYLHAIHLFVSFERSHDTYLTLNQDYLNTSIVDILPFALSHDELLQIPDDSSDDNGEGDSMKINKEERLAFDMNGMLPTQSLLRLRLNMLLKSNRCKDPSLIQFATSTLNKLVPGKLLMLMYIRIFEFQLRGCPHHSL